MVVVAPMPRARVKIATRAKAGLRRKVRRAYAMSCARSSMLIYSRRMRQAARNVTNAVTDAATHLGIDLADYDARIRTFIPGYETMIDTAAFALQVTMRRRRPVVVDLGIGTGAVAESCRGRLPGARIIGVDGDVAMLAAARTRLGSSLKTIHGNFEDIELPRC